jgi:hypothetical protein
LIVVDLNKLIESERLILEVSQVAEMWVDHLLHILGMKRYLELEFLSEISMELNEIFTLDGVCLTVLLTIEMLLDHREVLLIYFIVRLGKVCFADLKVTVPCIKFFLSDLLASCHVLCFGELFTERDDFFEEGCIVRVVVLCCSSLNFG